jgi:hypothetical protein
MMALEDLAHALGGELSQAQHACARAWPGTRIVAMQVMMAATVERIDASGTLALRVGRAPRGKQRVHQLGIEVSGSGAQAITVRLDGDPFGHYPSAGHGPAH